MKKRIIRVIFASILLLILFSFSAMALHPNIEDQVKEIRHWNDQLTAYAQGTSSLSLNEIIKISEQRKEEMIDLMKRSPASALLLILQKEIRDKLPAEVQNSIEKDFIGLGRLVMIIVDKEDGEEELFQLTREDASYDLFIANTKSLTPNTYYRVSGFILDNNIAVEDIKPLLGIKNDVPEINPYANGIQKIAFVKLSFKDSPFSYDPGGGKDQVEQAIDDVVNFYKKESFERMNIEAKIFEYTLPYDRSSFSCDESKGDGTQINPEDFLHEITLLKRQGKLHISHEYFTVLGLISEDFCGSTIGVAWLGGGYEFLTGIVKLFKPNEGLGSAMAHELGHIRLLSHSNQIPNCPECLNCFECLMWPSISPSNYLDHAIFLPQEKTLLSWDPKLSMPLAISDIKVWPIANLQGVPTGATLLWNENYYTSSEVYFGTEFENLQWKGSRSILDATSPRRFDLRGPEVNGKPTPLQLNTVYYYKIKSTGIQEPVKGVTTERRGSFFMVDKYWTRYPEIPEDQKLIGGGIVDQSSLFKRGDSNEDSRVDISDAVHILGVLFQGEPMPICPDKADTNDNGRIDLSDAIYLLGFLFQDKKPFPPYPEYGFDPTVDPLPECSF